MPHRRHAVPTVGRAPPDPVSEPVESVVVIELGAQTPSAGWGFLGILERREGTPREVILVCRRSALLESRPPTWVQVVPLPDDEHPSLASASRLGVVRATGDVIRLVAAKDLTDLPGSAGQFSSSDWLERLAEQGVNRPD